MVILTEEIKDCKETLSYIFVPNTMQYAAFCLNFAQNFNHILTFGRYVEYKSLKGALKLATTSFLEESIKPAAFSNKTWQRIALKSSL